MPKQITIKGKSPVDEDRRAIALLNLNEIASVEDLEKLAKMARNPIYKNLFKTVK